MGDDPTEAMVRREITAARRILREDRILAGLGKLIPQDPPAGGPEGPKAPPKTDPKDPPKRRGVWWGQELD